MKTIYLAMICALLGMKTVTAQTGFELAGNDPNKLIALKYLDLAWSQGKLQEARAMYYAPDFVNHPAERPMPSGNSASGENAPPPFSITYEFRQVFSDGEYVVVHSLVKDGPGVGEPISNPFSAGQIKIGDEVIDIFRIRNGKIIEKWDVVEPVSTLEVF